MQQKKRRKKVAVSLKSLIRFLGFVIFLAMIVTMISIQRHHDSQQSKGSNLLSLVHDNEKPESLLLKSSTRRNKRTRRNSVTAQDLGLTSTDTHDDNMLWSLQEAKRDKEPILKLLLEAGIENLDLPTLAKLPTWSTVRELYGDGPVIHGLDSCAAFRKSVPPEDASMGPAGIFNSGTNILYTLLASNCYLPNNSAKDMGIKWQVPWGKHMLASRKEHNTVAKEELTNKTHVLPIVVTRDPYTWMQSMCRNNYGLLWHHSLEHCPNLVPNQHDYRLYHFPGKNIPVRVKKWKSKGFATPIWSSMAHLWTDWYQQYFKWEQEQPRIMVRLEDLIFYPKQVVTQICTCAGGEPISPNHFNYMVDSAKYGTGHGSNKTSLVGAMIKYGSKQTRLEGYTKEDLQLAREALNEEMMTVFQYLQPNVP